MKMSQNIRQFSAGGMWKRGVSGRGCRWEGMLSTKYGEGGRWEGSGGEMGGQISS